MLGLIDLTITIGDDLPRPGPPLLIEKILILGTAIKCPDDKLDTFERCFLDEKGEELEKPAPFLGIRHEAASPIERTDIPFMSQEKQIERSEVKFNEGGKLNYMGKLIFEINPDMLFLYAFFPSGNPHDKKNR
jgi:hypothetical protein